MGEYGQSEYGQGEYGQEEVQLVYLNPATPKPLSLIIAGVERIGIYRPGSGSINRQIKGRSTASFMLFDATQVFRPAVGSPVSFDDTVTTFAGTIDKITEIRDGDGLLDQVRFNCDCVDYSEAFDRRIVWRRYPSGSIFNAIISDIVTNFLDDEGFDITHVDGFGVIANDLDFQGRSVAECLNTLSDMSGEQWWTLGHELWFKSVAFAPLAAFGISDTSANWRGLEVEYSRAMYRNRQWVRAGVNLSYGVQTETHTGDGSTYFWPTEWALSSAPRVTVGGVVQTIYEAGVDPQPSAGWFWIRGGRGVYQGQASPPGVGVAVVVEYGQFASNSVKAEDTAEIAARAAVEGNSGIYESVTEARDVDRKETADDLAAGLLARNKILPKTIRYETDNGGLNPGDAQVVDLSANNISSETFYITQIASRAMEWPFYSNGEYFRHRITLSNIHDAGWLGWWLNFFGRTKLGDAGGLVDMTPTDLVNGVYSATRTPAKVYVDGSLQHIDDDYTVSGTTVTFKAVSIPRVGAKVQCE